MRNIIPKLKPASLGLRRFKNPTIQEVLEKYPPMLRDIFGPPRNDVELMLMHMFKKDRSFLIAHPDKRLRSDQYARFKVVFALRKKEWPLQYIFGKVDFMGCELRVNNFTLIPRPETEQLVELAAEYIKNNSIRNIVDLGTGSGAIIISLYKILSPTKINYNYIATDKSAKTLQVARFNELKNKTNINFRVRDYLHRPNTFIPLTSWVLISNPPYVSVKALNEPSIKHEPKMALSGGVDGLDAYRKILSQVGTIQHKPKAIFFEIGFDQAQAIKEIAKNNFSVKDFKVYKDFNNHDRVVRIIL